MMHRLADIYAAFDDDALASLANKGLVRRARKDLEKSVPRELGEENGKLRLAVEEATVLLAEVPAQSTCTCNAGICRHILTAIMFVRQNAASPADAPAAAATPAISDADLLGLNDDQLLEWAGKLLYRKGLLMAAQHEAAIEMGSAIAIRFPAINVTCRWMPGGGLAAMLCSCHKPAACEHKVAAVLAYHNIKAGKILDITETAREASADAARTRDEVRASVHQLLCEITAIGFSRLSSSAVERLKTLAMSAHGVDLPRLERQLKSLADEIQQLLARNAQASSSSLLLSAARTEALCAALAKPTPALIGQHRSQYEPITGELELMGLGARRWQSRSGYVGLTLYFWDVGGSRFTSWCDARPLNTPGFDPVARYHQGGPWTGCKEPYDACRNSYRVAGAWRNLAGRISGRESTRAIGIGKSDLARLPAITQWRQLTTRLNSLFGGGLAQHTEVDELVLLQVASATPATFNAVRQEATQIMVDQDQKLLPLILKHLTETPQAVTNMEHVDPAQLHHVLGLLKLGADGLYVEPITYFAADRAINLTLDGVARRQAQPAADRSVNEDQTDDAVEEADDEQEAFTSARAPVANLLSGALRELEAIGEAGVGAPRNLDPLKAAARHCGSIGLETCGKSINQALDLMESYRRSVQRDSAPPAAAVLRACYILRLALENHAVAGAAAAMQ